MADLTQVKMLDNEDNIRTVSTTCVYVPPEKEWYRRFWPPWPRERRCLKNNIHTTKYSLLTFLPKNLFEQFHRIANIYFLIVVVLNYIPAVNVVYAESAVIPLIVVLGITAIKDGIEDLRRYYSDKDVNNRKCRIYDWKEQTYNKSQWKNVRLGDFLRVVCNEVIPADIVLLHSSEPEGICYVETANLDGETTLKVRHTVKDTSQSGIFLPEGMTGEIHCNQPSKTSDFSGYLEQQDGSRISINSANLLLRGCTLRNTEEVVGVVMYAGHETKAMLNNNGPRSKRSKLERDMNWEIFSCGIILLILCIGGAIGSSIWSSNYKEMPYFPFNENAVWEGFIRFWSMIVILQVIIPLSLYITMELIKVFQVYFISRDIDLYYSKGDKRITCKSLNLTEDLGQVQYIFSDKTGTLTENEMLFRCCSIGGISYPHGLDSQFAALESGLQTPDILTTSHQNEKTLIEFYLDEELLAKVGKLNMQPVPCVNDFMLTMTLCNSVVVSDHSFQAGEFNLLQNSRSMYSSMISLRTTLQALNISLQNLQLRIQTNLQSTYHNIHSKVQNLQNTLQNFQSRLHNPISSSQDPEELCNNNSEDTFLQTTLPGTCQNYQSDSDSKMDCDSGAETDVPKSQTLQPAAVKCPAWPQTMLEQVEEIVGHCDLDSLVYEAESPDELALVNAARNYGYALLHRSQNKVVILTLYQGVVEYDVLQVLPFDSERKMMSVIVQEVGTSDIIMYSKGADSAILNKLNQSPSQGSDNTEAFCVDDGDASDPTNATEHHLNLYAKLGLRTLCLAKKTFKLEEYHSWLTEHHKAEVSISDRERLMHQSYCRAETELELLGVTGIEDRLQDGVPQTIDSLRQAGIQIWMLTGDKKETAINIGYSSHILHRSTEVLTINAENEEDCFQSLAVHLNEMNLKNSLEDSAHSSWNNLDTLLTSVVSVTRPFIPLVGRQGRQPVNKGSSKAIVFEGSILNYCLKPKVKETFLSLIGKCDSVICCRATPLQKANLVKAVKKHFKAVSLAVGDGANDVSMIQVANVGVGLSGNEGQQAAQSSDFAMGRFMFLKKLLLVHGHWCYARLASILLYFYYKNLAFALLLFWYQLLNGFSGSTAVDSINLMGFNLIFTSVPIIVVGVLDQDLQSHSLLSETSVYSIGSQSRHYTRLKFWIIFVEALYHSLVCFFVPLLANYSGTVTLAEFGFYNNLSLLILVTLTLALQVQQWTPFHHLTIWGSLVLSFLFNFVYCSLQQLPKDIFHVHWVLQTLSAHTNFWAVLALATLIGIFPRLLVMALYRLLFSSPIYTCKLKEKENRSSRKIKESTILPETTSTI